MKKGLLIGALVGILVGALVVAGYAFAQTPTPVPQFPFGRGMMGGRQQGGMMGGYGNTGQHGPMHEYMEKAFAEALGLTQEDLETALDSGKTMWQVAQEKGLTQEQFQQAMLEARQNAFEQMVADGVITQTQANWMLSHMQNLGGQGGRFGGQGGCPGMGGSYSGPGSQWNSPSAQPTPSTSS
jgi:hypothetical protein